MIKQMHHNAPLLSVYLIRTSMITEYSFQKHQAQHNDESWWKFETVISAANKYPHVSRNSFILITFHRLSLSSTTGLR